MILVTLLVRLNSHVTNARKLRNKTVNVTNTGTVSTKYVRLVLLVNSQEIKKVVIKESSVVQQFSLAIRTDKFKDLKMNVTNAPHACQERLSLTTNVSITKIQRVANAGKNLF